MGILLDIRLVRLGLVIALAQFATAGSTKAAPEVTDLVRSGKETLEKLPQKAAAWTARCQLPNGAILDIDVLRDGARQSWKYIQFIDRRPVRLCDIIQTEGVWHVLEKGHALKCRPYEAELHFPGAYFFLSLSQLRCLVDAHRLASAELESHEGGKLAYRVPVTGEVRRMLEQVVSESAKIARQNLASASATELAQTVAQAREQLARGTLVVIDEKSGIMVQTKVRDIVVSIVNFRWLDKVPSDAFALPRAVVWDDQSEPWPASDLENCIMVGRDPAFTRGASPSLDTSVLNLKTGRLRRVPYPGVTSMPGCFLKSHQSVLVSGLDVDGQFGLVKVDLASGKNEAVTYGRLGGGLSMMAELSPDGKRAATLQGFGAGNLMDFQLQLIEVGTGRVESVGKPRRIGGPLSWLPDGSGVVLKRFGPVNDPKAIEPRILCRIDLDGTLTDLRNGDWPVVLRKMRKILYQENDSRLWHTCDLDGSHPELFADGLKGHAMPAVSPDERQIVFSRYEKGKAPELMLFDLGKSAGKPVVQAAGFVGTPAWR